MKFISQVLAAVCAMMSLVAISLVAFLAIPITYNAIARMFGHATTWAFQITLYVFIAAGFLANPAALRSGAHFRIKMIHAFLPRMGRALDIFAMLMTIGVSLVLMAAGGAFVFYSWSNHIYSASIFEVPLWIPESAIPIGGLGLFLQTLLLLINGDGIDGTNETNKVSEE